MKHAKVLGILIAAGSLLLAGPVFAQDGDTEYQSLELSQFDEPEEDEYEDEAEEFEEEADEETEEFEEEADEEQEELEREQEEIREREEAWDEQAEEQDEEDPMADPEELDEPYDEPSPLIEDEQRTTLTPWGLGVLIGGGVNGFTDSDFNDFVDTGGGWDGRVILGTRTMLGFEAGYSGTANGLDTFGVEDDAILLSNGAEGVFRLGLADAPVRPYVLAGAGWKHYEVTNTDVNTSNLQNSDNVIDFPLGAGLSYSYDRFLADLRGTFRPAVDDELMRSAEAQEENSLHTWRAGANVGFEF
ncbi:MAG: outer membrane protein [Persicimonas sp.]